MPTTARWFVDTNVLVYAFDDGEPAKRDRARELLAKPGAPLALSAQVIGEFYVVVTRKLATSRSAQLSYWDALIVEAAAAAGCDRLLTEDLTHGATVRTVLVQNPFA